MILETFLIFKIEKKKTFFLWKNHSKSMEKKTRIGKTHIALLEQHETFYPHFFT